MLHRLIPAAALVAAFPASAQTLSEFADQFDQAQIRQDGPALAAMISDDLVFIDGGGARLGKAEFVAGWLDPSLKFEPIAITGRYVIPLGPDAGIVGGEVVLRGNANGTPFASHIRFADTFRRVDGRWQAVHIQVTRVPAQ